VTGRTTPAGGDRPLPSLRERRPGVYWMTIALATLMLLSLLLPTLAVLFS
jgi:hypothetical protein